MYYPGLRRKRGKKEKDNADILLLNQKQIDKLMEQNKKPIYKNKLKMD